MANVIRLTKGLDIKLKGIAAEEFFDVKSPERYALVPDDYAGITPKMVVKEQDYVKAGSALFVDKNHPEVKFVSPVSGIVAQIERGARRKILFVSVTASETQEYVDFGRKDVEVLSSAEIKELMAESGLFAFVRQRPYDIVSYPEVEPRAIFVSAFDTNPLAPNFEYVLKGEEDAFQTGLTALSRIAKTYLNIRSTQSAVALTDAKNVTVSVFEGPHPAGNVGVQINHIAPVNKNEVVWTLSAQSVIYLGRLFLEGHTNFVHAVALTGSEVAHPAYVRLQLGAQLTNVFAGRVSDGKDLRYISGNVLTGRKISADGYLGAYDNQLTVIPEGDEVHEEFGWIAPRLNDFSMNRSYFSWLFGEKKQYTLDARIKGGQRHMIMSDEYTKVLPMDILPEYLIKAILAGDIDRMQALGIYEVAPEDFALCEFVCSSKMELQRIVREGLDMLRAEMN